MDIELRAAGLTEFASSFIDDMVVYIKTMKEHLVHVDRVLKALIKVNLFTHPGKTLLLAIGLPFLGHFCGRAGLSPADVKVAAIKETRAPTSLKQMQQFLGFINYYRCYIPNFSIIAEPLYCLTAKALPFIWGAPHNTALEQLKAAVCTENLVLGRIHPDSELCLYTDWSCKRLGAVLAHREPDGNERLVACISRSLH